MPQALIFDFDGLILDTETPESQTWQELYAAHDFELPRQEWYQIIGGYGLSDFDPALRLVELSAGELNPDQIRADYRRRADALVLAQPILPGIAALLEEAKRAELSLAIGSSSTHSWVDAHAQRLGIWHFFDLVICADDVPPGRTKPHPDIYLAALEGLQADPRRAIVFEDSPNGVLAAQRAGVFVVAVPNPLTAQMGARGDWTTPSLANVNLNQLRRLLSSHWAADARAS